MPDAEQTSRREAVVLREVGLRDGLQLAHKVMPTVEKRALFEALMRAGVRNIEVTSLVPPKLMPQFADADEMAAIAAQAKDVVSSALVPNLKGVERGIALGFDKLVFVLSASEGHNRANVRRTANESIAEFARAVELCRAQENPPRLVTGVGTAFGCTIDGAIDEGRVMEIAMALLDAGADEIGLADTVGVGNPKAVRRLFDRLVAVAEGRPVWAHLHDTRGMGIANAYAALEAGVRNFDGALGGLGGCPFAPGASGNVATEDLAFLLEGAGFETGIDIEALAEARALLAAFGEPLKGSILVAGLPKGFAEYPR